MTREEAREVLQEQIDKYGKVASARGIEALEFAIKALEEDAVNRMDSINFGANLFEKAIEMQTKTIRACDVIVKIDKELSTMPEPFKMDFICLVTRAVDKCENMNNKEAEENG